MNGVNMGDGQLPRQCSAAFTPGPWEVELDKVFVGTPPEYTLIADADPDGLGGYDGKQPMLANARLIAAAPELYELLLCKGHADNLPSEPEWLGSAAQQIADIARAALAKARGEQ